VRTVVNGAASTRAGSEGTSDDVDDAFSIGSGVGSADSLECDGSADSLGHTPQMTYVSAEVA